MRNYLGGWIGRVELSGRVSETGQLELSRQMQIGETIRYELERVELWRAGGFSILLLVADKESPSTDFLLRSTEKTPNINPLSAASSPLKMLEK